MNKRIISGLAALAVVFSGAGSLPTEMFEGFSLTASAAEIVKSGEFGENLTWTLDSEGTLTVSGTGDMENYSLNKSPVYAISKDIKQIVINNGVTSIGSYAFSYCDAISVTIPDSVTGIGDYAFGYCKALSDIALPDSLTSIGYLAFCNCTSLKSITIPGSVTKLSSDIFRGCKNLESVTLPNSITAIGDDAFIHCTSLKNITLPNSVKSIGYNAFSGCTSLKSIIIPKKVRKIVGCAFYGCTSLTNVTLPDSVTKIESDAFLNCSKLKSVTIPANVTSIGKNALGYIYFGMDSYKKVEGFTIMGDKGTAAETYAAENEFNFVPADKYPVVTYEVKGRQFRFKWTAVPDAEGYGLTIYQSGKWRLKEQFEADVTAYTSPKIKAGAYRMTVCAKVNGEWDTSSLSKRAFTVTIE